MDIFIINKNASYFLKHHSKKAIRLMIQKNKVEHNYNYRGRNANNLSNSWKVGKNKHKKEIKGLWNANLHWLDATRRENAKAFIISLLKFIHLLLLQTLLLYSFLSFERHIKTKHAHSHVFQGYVRLAITFTLQDLVD